MLKDNLVMLRKLHGYSQEELSEKIGISRQAYAKWESGATIPDVEKCSLLAEVYGTTIDSLIKTTTVDVKASVSFRNITSVNREGSSASSRMSMISADCWSLLPGCWTHTGLNSDLSFFFQG